MPNEMKQCPGSSPLSFDHRSLSLRGVAEAISSPSTGEIVARGLVPRLKPRINLGATGEDGGEGAERSIWGKFQMSPQAESPLPRRERIKVRVIKQSLRA